MKVWGEPAKFVPWLFVYSLYSFFFLVFFLKKCLLLLRLLLYSCLAEMEEVGGWKEHLRGSVHVRAGVWCTVFSRTFVPVFAVFCCVYEKSGGRRTASWIHHVNEQEMDGRLGARAVETPSTVYAAELKMSIKHFIPFLTRCDVGPQSKGEHMATDTQRVHVPSLSILEING